MFDMFSSPEKRATALDNAIEEFDSSYAKYTPTQRETAMGLLGTVLKYTRGKDMEALAGDLIPLVMALLPLISNGKVGEQLIVGINEHAPEVRRDAMATLGPERWAQELESATSSALGASMSGASPILTGACTARARDARR
jgi:hypothetical protein